MKRFFGGLAVVAALSVAPAFADVAYTNGPISGTIDSWLINNGSQVADSFTVASSDPLTGVSFGLWLNPGDTATAVDWAIFTDPANQVNLFAGTASVTLTDTFANTFNYEVSTATFSLPNITGLTIGTTYWLAFSNLATTNNDGGWWDENNGPSSLSWQSDQGFFAAPASESFTISSTATPEPGSLALGGTGLLLLAGALRRKLIR